MKVKFNQAAHIQKKDYKLGVHEIPKAVLKDPYFLKLVHHGLIMHVDDATPIKPDTTAERLEKFKALIHKKISEKDPDPKVAAAKLKADYDRDKFIDDVPKSGKPKKGKVKEEEPVEELDPSATDPIMEYDEDDLADAESDEVDESDEDEVDEDDADEEEADEEEEEKPAPKKPAAKKKSVKKKNK